MANDIANKIFQGFYEILKNNKDKLSENAGNYMNLIYSKALEGIPQIKDEPVEKLVEDYLLENKNPETAIKKLIDNQVKKCTASGFVTGLPGGPLVMAAIPANIGSVLYTNENGRRNCKNPWI